jgi:ubiquinone/menaquinone biosynthesis C-methylase UbiE
MNNENQLKENEQSDKENTLNTIYDNVWSLGDYRIISTMLPPISSHLVKLLHIQPKDTVLDVACGNGNSAIAARSLGANVTGVDITPELLSLAAEEERTSQISGIVWKLGDAQNLPFDDESFDVVLSTFGHMFAANPEFAAKELIRVTKKGGRIGFATWPPELAIGAIFRTNAKHLSKANKNNAITPPPSPLLWGIPEVVEKRMNGVSEIYFDRGTTTFSMLSPNHFWEFMSTNYGPMIKVIQTLKNQSIANEPQSLRNDFLKALNPYFVNNGIRLGYLLTLAIK